MIIRNYADKIYRTRIANICYDNRRLSIRHPADHNVILLSAEDHKKS